ncbi:hypothetical protein G6L37_02155 [Agrobacterium rubi]|nr:hypothetical protein [Agrobacterium rubi]NTF24197.1 hypothetical protein [Agrobacterium rubi]
MDSRQKVSLIQKRVSALGFSERVFKDADRIVEKSGMTLPGIVDELWKEWLNDLVATTNGAEYRTAARDPGGHFLDWLRVRATRRFHVTWRAMDKLSRAYGPEVATHFTSIIWPQEIAWAQRMRTFDNPHVATRAALFLRETEGKPSKTFEALSDIYAETIRTIIEIDSPAKDLTPEEIRFSENLPDHTPMFLRYASRAYKDVLDPMDRERIELLADRARRDEMADRAAGIARQMAAAARLNPMRQSTSVISAAISLGIGPNELYLAETAFLDRLERGDVVIEPGLRTPQMAFITAISDRKSRKVLVSSSISPEIDPPVDIWEVANLDRRWLADLPQGFSVFQGLRASFESWKLAIVQGSRNIPYDRISDFGFFISGSVGVVRSANA